MPTLTPPPPTLAATREALRTLACYVIAPARKARTGRIGLRPTGDGIATPPFDDGSRIVVHGDRLIVEPGIDVQITTLRAAAEALGLALSPDPGVGSDLPPFDPDADLAVDAAASLWLGTWYAYASQQLDSLTAKHPRGTISEAQLWPEHFDLAVTVNLDDDGVNVGFSPGDANLPTPYVYVGPHNPSRPKGDYWNAPFGAMLSLAELLVAHDPDTTTENFVENGLRLLAARSATA